MSIFSGDRRIRQIFAIFGSIIKKPWNVFLYQNVSKRLDNAYWENISEFENNKGFNVVQNFFLKKFFFHGIWFYLQKFFVLNINNIIGLAWEFKEFWLDAGVFSNLSYILPAKYRPGDILKKSTYFYLHCFKLKKYFSQF